MNAPRRARAQWLDADCPTGVLAIFDNGGKTLDRYTVLYVPEPGADYIAYLAASTDPFAPGGFGQYVEGPLHEIRAYRYRATSAGESTKWSALPEDVKRAVRQDLGVDNVQHA